MQAIDGGSSAAGLPPLALAVPQEGPAEVAAVVAPVQADGIPHLDEEERLALLSRLGSLATIHTGSGYYGVTKERSNEGKATTSQGNVRPYLAQIRRGGRQVKLGRFATAEEAARAYARAMEPADVAKLLYQETGARMCKMTAEEAQACAEAEGLTLHAAPGTKSGYRGVGVQKSVVHPYMAIVQVNSKAQNLGCFATPEQAALVYARHVATLRGPAAASGSSSRRPAGPRACDVAQLARDEGLTLHIAPKTQTGFKGVWKSQRATLTRPFRAEFRCRKLGSYDSAEAAALEYARAAAFHQAQPCAPGRTCTCLFPWLEAPAPATQTESVLAVAEPVLAVAEPGAGPAVAEPEPAVAETVQTVWEAEPRAAEPPEDPRS